MTPLEAPADRIRAAWFAGAQEHALGRAVGVNQFGVNHLTLAPGAYSALRHWHEGEDEFVYVVEGEVSLIDDNGEHVLTQGGFAGFPAGVANAHHLANRSSSPASLIVVGARQRGLETIHYPDDPELGIGTVLRDADGERVAR
ncbi:MAG TPA: cupin domain-containing protein [Caulobacteraceae bacterium]